jgi:hypothetical protein
MTSAGMRGHNIQEVAIERLFVVVSGMPASGKTTLAVKLAEEFRLPLLDKDDILEALFDTLGPSGLAARQPLSRASDRVLMKLASLSHGAVLTSFWRHGTDGDSGTPADWITDLSPKIVEAYCLCSPEIALHRFTARARHPGHSDGDRSPHALHEQFQKVAERGPLGVGSTVIVDTSRPDPHGVALSQIRAAVEVMGR